MLACGRLGSGLRVYNIQDPNAPREIAYYNTGTIGPDDPLVDWAWSRPVIRRDRRQIWWTTFHDGFHVASFRGDGWPAADDPCPPGYDYFRAQYDLVYQACKAG